MDEANRVPLPEPHAVYDDGNWLIKYTEGQMLYFAAAAVAAEREACARLCDQRAAEMWGFIEEEHCAQALADAIRARSAPPKE